MTIRFDNHWPLDSISTNECIGTTHSKRGYEPSILSTSPGQCILEPHVVGYWYGYRLDTIWGAFQCALSAAQRYMRQLPQSTSVSGKGRSTVGSYPIERMRGTLHLPHNHRYLSIYCTCNTLLLNYATFLLCSYALVRRIMKASVKELGIVDPGSMAFTGHSRH